MGIPVFEYKTDKDKAFGNMIPHFKLTAFRLPHDGESNFGTLIYTESGHRMAYLTDFEYCPYVFAKQKLNTILIECNHMDDIAEDDNEGKYSHVLRGHSSISTVCEFLRVNQTEELKTIILCHLSTDNADPDEMVRQVQEVVGSSVRVIVARKGVSITL